jgi:uncharacterized protein YbaR (Trm112 family)
MTQHVISTVLNMKTGQTEEAQVYLDQLPYLVGKERRALEEHIQDHTKYLVCPYCRQSLKIKSITGKYAAYFAHLKDSDACEIKTDSNHTREEICAITYNRVTESHRHKIMKEMIIASVCGDPQFSHVKQESIIRDNQNPKKWR